MRQRLHNVIAAILLIFSIGGQWAILQSGAWVGMFISFSRNDTVAEAMVKTFDGNHPCRVCQFVTEGKNAEKKHEQQLPKIKIDFFLVNNPGHCWNPQWFELEFPFYSAGTAKIYSPPTPPPRYS